MNVTAQIDELAGTPPSVAGVSTAGRRFGHAAAKAALSPSLSRISEGNENSSCVLKGGADSSEISITTDKVRALARRAMASKFAVAGLVFLVTCTMLCVINPPMAQQAATDPAAPPVRSVKKILIWSSLATVMALLLPYGKSLVKKSE